MNASANEKSGVWATQCEINGKIDPNSLWIIRVTDDGLYQVGEPKHQMSKPTPILGAKDFKIIDKNTLIYKNRIYKHCSKKNTPTYKTISEDQIKKYIQGEWKLSPQSINTNINDLSISPLQDPDINVLNIDKTTLNLKGEKKPIKYKVDADNLLLKLDKWRSVKVILVDQKELQLTLEMKPAKGVFIYYKNKKK